MIQSTSPTSVDDQAAAEPTAATAAPAAQDVLILGPTEYALELCDVLEDAPGVQVRGFIEAQDQDRCRRLHGGLPVYWVEDLGDRVASHVAVCALGTTLRVPYVERVARQGIPFATIAHPTAHVSRRATLGKGVTVGVGCTVAAFARIGNHVRINRRAIIGHHLQIDDFVTLQPGCNIASGVQVGRAAYIGMSAVVVDGVRVGAHSVVGAGAVVTKDVPDRVQVVGVPARIVKRNIKGK